LTTIVSRFLKSPIRTLREEQTLVKFLVVGGSGALLNVLVSYYLGQSLRIFPDLAQGTGIELSIISNFVWNDTFTFKNVGGSAPQKSHGRLSRFLKYNLLSLGTAALNLGIFSVLYYKLGMNEGFWYASSSLIAILVAFVFNYLGSSRWAWKKDQPKTLEIQKNSAPIKE
jgi:dolichol-phosphate mannosyltransferase